MAHSEFYSSDPSAHQLIEAARSGQADAYYELGILYSVGRGVDIDYIEAHKWFNLAAMRGIKRAQADRAELAAEMSSCEIAEAQRMAREWLGTATH